VTPDNISPPGNLASRQAGASPIRDAFHAGEEGAIAAVRCVLYRALRQARVRPDDACANAEELLGDVWLESTRPPPDDATFLLEVKRLAWRHARRSARHAWLPLAGAEPIDASDPVSGAVRAEIRSLLAGLLLSFEPETRRFFRLRYFRGESLRRCSGHLGLSFRGARKQEGLIREALSRAIPGLQGAEPAASPALSQVFRIDTPEPCPPWVGA